MLSIQTNIAALSAQNALTTTNNSLQTSMARLSSGFRINHAADDAAGLAISEKMQAQIGGLNQAVRNANDGASMIQTGEGALDQVQTMMIRMRNLAVQAASDTNGPQERADINVELQQLQSEIDNISKRTTFNGLGLLNGTLAVQADATSLAAFKTAGAAGLVSTTALSGTLGTGGSQIDGVTMGQDTEPLGSGYSFTYAAGVLTATSTTGATDTAAVSAIGANGSAVYTFAKLGISVGVTAGAAGLNAADVGTGLIAAGTITSGTTSHSAVLQTGADATAANTTSVSMLDTRLTGGTSAEMGAMAATLAQFNTDVGTSTGATDNDATNLITAIDTANAWISSQRAQLGAAQNRLGYAAASLTTTAQNVTAANSQIRDVDVASETSNMSKDQILMQAGISVLAQANQVQQLALKLLT
ncbi:MAG: flagellin [Polyangia bacterium]